MIFTKKGKEKRKKAHAAQMELPGSLYRKGRGEGKEKYYVNGKLKDSIELMEPDGLNPIPLDYMTIQDGGETVYFLGLYIDKLPRFPTIASTFSVLFNFDGVTSSVFINPLLGQSIKKVNRRIDMLDAEIYGAQKEGDRNRLRELTGKLENTEAWARRIDSGENSLYEVQFLFLPQARSLEKLQLKVSDFQSGARKRGIELSACYCAHPEAFLSSLPLNRVFKTQIGRVGVAPVKKHIMDKMSLATIFNHTQTEFFHEEGICLGRNLYSGLPVCFDPYDKSHLSYGVIVAGKTGYGKSATVKQIFSRLVDFGVHLAVIDFEPRGARGEYSAMAEAVGGVSYTISSDSKVRLNLFEVGEESGYDAITGEEYPVLQLNDKIVDLSNILLTMALSASIESGSTVLFDAEVMTRMRTIITRIVKQLYADFGIIDGKPESLYETEGIAARKKFQPGRKKKRQPQMRDFYMELLRQHESNEDEFKENAFHLLLDIFEENVEELFYCPMCLTTFTREEYEQLPKLKDASIHKHGDKTIPIQAIHGTKAYFDAQSTVELDKNLPCINFDISQAPEGERPILQLICQNFINETLIKTNSLNPKLARKLIVSTDEAYKLFPYESARRFQNSLYRTARKRHVSPWLIMQSVADLGRYTDTEEILKSTEMYLLFKHSYQDKDYIKTLTNITESQVDTILELGGENSEKKRPGELCLIDTPTKRAVFIKADYLRDSEQYIVETDMEILAQMAVGR